MASAPPGSQAKHGIDPAANPKATQLRPTSAIYHIRQIDAASVSDARRRAQLEGEANRLRAEAERKAIEETMAQHWEGPSHQRRLPTKADEAKRKAKEEEEDWRLAEEAKRKADEDAKRRAAELRPNAALYARIETERQKEIKRKAEEEEEANRLRKELREAQAQRRAGDHPEARQCGGEGPPAAGGPGAEAVDVHDRAKEAVNCARLAKEFGEDLKWYMWNVTWGNVNQLRAWRSKNDRHVKLLKRSEEDLKRGEEHLRRLEASGCLSQDILRHLKALCDMAATGANNQMSSDKGQGRSVSFKDKIEELNHGLSRSPTAMPAARTGSTLSRDPRTSAQGEHAKVAQDLGDKAMEVILEALGALSAYVVANLQGSRKAGEHKAGFEKSCRSFPAIYELRMMVKDEPPVQEVEEDWTPLKNDFCIRQQHVAEQDFDQRERDIWEKTQKEFVPQRTSPGVGKGRVSVVTPTTEQRQAFHRILWASFLAQDWPDKELVVVETYRTAPSPYLQQVAKRDRRLVHCAFERPRGSDWSIGLKRNIGACLATGEFLANFDDDDLYAPTYLSTMISHMKAAKAIGITLATWFVYETSTQRVGQSDPRKQFTLRAPLKDLLEVDSDVAADVAAKTSQWEHETLYGFGFSYVHTRQSVLDYPYDHINMGEDYKFFARLMKKNGQDCIALHEDNEGICLHTQHAKNTARDFALWGVHQESVDRLQFRHFFPVFDWYRRLCRQSKVCDYRDADEDPFEVDQEWRLRPPSKHVVEVHLGGRAHPVECLADMRCGKLLEQALDLAQGSVPERPKVFRIPEKPRQATANAAATWEQALYKAMKALSPICSPPSHFRRPPDQMEEEDLELLERVKRPFENDEFIGWWVREVWIRDS